MDDIFTKCVDHIALAGPKGITCRTCVERVVEHPRPALVKWLYRNCKKREPSFFQVNGDDFETAIVVACKSLRERALGFSSLEHFPLQPTAWDVFYAVGRAGKDGVLQSELAKELKIGPVMLHHYLGSLLTLKLVVRRRIVLSAKRRKGENGFPMLSGGKAAHVTQTCVIALARYASTIGSLTASANTGDQTPGVTDDTEPVIHNLAIEERTEFIIRLLSEAPGGIIPERDLKLRVISSAGGIRSRHRAFRTIRDKIVKAGLVKKVTRKCVDAKGNNRGDMPCLQLVGSDDEVGADQVVKVATDYEDEGKSDQEQDDGVDVERQEMDTGEEKDTPGMLFEVDIAEQVYRAFDKAQSRGMSCPEIVSMLDGNTGSTGIEYKRMRSLLNIMENNYGLKTVQHFNASACHKRFVLKEHHKKEGNEWPPENGNEKGNPSSKQSSKPKHVGRGRTVNGNLTTLGSRRRVILINVLEKEKVILAEKIGKIISEAEGNSAGHVDVKISRKIVKTMIDDKLCRYVSVAKPRFGSAKKDTGTMQLLVAQDVTANGKEIRDFLARFVKRSMSTPDGRGGIPTTRRNRKSSVRKSVIRQGDEDEAEVTTPKLKRLKHKVTRTDAELKNPGECGIVKQSTSEMPTIDTDPTAKMPEERSRKERVATNGVLIENPGRGPANLRSVRLNKLRVQDHGFVSARMRRCQLLHEYLVRFVMDEDFITSDAIVTHSTMEIAGSAEDLGKFGYDEILRSMSVGLFANLFGIATYDQELTEEMKKIPMKDAPEAIRSELTGRLPIEQTRILFKLLWELGLVYSVSNADWFLRGAGVFRDFGKGLPNGYSVHSILFNSYRAVTAFWNELESLSNSVNALAGYKPNPQSAISFAKEILGLKEGIDGLDGTVKQIQGPDLSAVYIPSNWVPPRRGNVGTIVEDELTMEMVLQKIVVGWEDDGKMPKDISSWNLGLLPWLPVSVLYDNRVLLDNGYRRRRKRVLQLCDVEYLVQYARKRISRRVAKKVVLLAEKPNNNISDYNWLRKSDLFLTANSRKRRARTKLERAEKNQRTKLESDINVPGPIEEEKKTSLLDFEDCVHLLTMHVKSNALVGHWKERKMELPESNEFVWQILTQALGRPEDDYRRKIEEIRDNELVSRYAKTVENCLVQELSELKVSRKGDDQLDQVPDKLVDSFGQELILEDVFCAVLNESKLLFNRKLMEKWSIPVSRRKNILRRLRSYMTGYSATVSVPNPVSLSKSGHKKQRSRLLFREDKDGDLRYGIIKVLGDDPKWMVPNSTSISRSLCREVLVTQVLIAILTESDAGFDPRSALLILSRFPNSQVLEIRNGLYEEKHISLRKNNRRAFEVQKTIKRSETPLTNEGHSMFAIALNEIKSLGDANSNTPGNKVLDQISSLSNGTNSQTSLMALTQTILFQNDNSSVKVIPEIRDGKLQAVFASTDVTNGDNISLNEIENGATTNVTREDVITELRTAYGDGKTNEQQSEELSFKIDDEDRSRIESEWVSEVNMRRLREQTTLAYYKSQQNSVFGDIFGWITASGQKGLSSYDIREKSIQYKYSDEDVIEAIQELVKEGVVHRFGFGNKEKGQHRAAAIYMGMSYAWRFAVAPISKSASKSFGLDWGRGRPISPWTTSSGLYNMDLINSVQVHILNIVARNPGISETDLVASMSTRDPLITERVLLDVIGIMFRSGRISRKVYSENSDDMTIFGTRSSFVVQETSTTLYLDGLELSNSKRNFTFCYSACSEAFGNLLSGEQLEQVI